MEFFDIEEESIDEIQYLASSMLLSKFEGESLFLIEIFLSDILRDETDSKSLLLTELFDLFGPSGIIKKLIF